MIYFSNEDEVSFESCSGKYREIKSSSKYFSGFFKLLDAILLKTGPRPPLRPIISGEDGPISNFNKGVAARQPHFFKIPRDACWNRFFDCLLMSTVNPKAFQYSTAEYRLCEFPKKWEEAVSAYLCCAASSKCSYA